MNKGNKEFKDKIERRKRHDDVIDVLRKKNDWDGNNGRRCDDFDEMGDGNY